MPTHPTKFMIRRAQKSGKRYKVKPSDILDLIYHESSFTPNASSSAGAQGLTQFLPSTAGAYGVKFGTDKHAQKTQIRGAAKLLHASGYKAGNESAIRMALAKYYSGSGSVPSPYADALLSEHQYEKYDKGALVGKSGGGGKGKKSISAPGTPPTSKQVQTAPAKSLAGARATAALSFIQTPDKTWQDYAGFQAQMESLQDVPAQTKTVTTPGTPGMKGDKDIKGGGKIKGKGGGPTLKGGSTHEIVQIGKWAQKMGLNVGENPHFGGVAPVHVTGSYHYSGRAIDVSGSPDLMRKFAHKVAKAYGPKLAELFWQGAGGIDIDNGSRVPQGFVSDHTDHVHVAI